MHDVDWLQECGGYLEGEDWDCQTRRTFISSLNENNRMLGLEKDSKLLRHHLGPMYCSISDSLPTLLWVNTFVTL